MMLWYLIDNSLPLYTRAYEQVKGWYIESARSLEFPATLNEMGA